MGNLEFANYIRRYHAQKDFLGIHGWTL
ncbi:hypothetical protein [uncultured Lactobacillus sp.]|nr:hypothetical protein [uncultured Lactobacillus sp.]